MWARPSSSGGRVILSDFFRLLRSQGLGILCGLATVTLLATGSVVIASTADGVSSGVRMDDVTWFFTNPSPWHIWFYLLLPILGLYALNTVLSTWYHVINTWKQGLRRLRSYAPAIIHVAFLVALVAHLVGGLWGEERGVVQLGPVWNEMPGGSAARVATIDETKYPNGQVKQAVVTLDMKTEAGEEFQQQIEYNGPITGGWGSHLVLLVRHQWVTHHGTTYPLVLLRSRRTPGNPWALASAVLLVGGILMMGRRWFRRFPPAGE